MKLAVVGTLVAILGGAGAGAWMTGEQYRADQVLIKDIFERACEITYYDCSKAVVPTVRRSKQVSDQHFKGVYMGGAILWIEEDQEHIQSVLTMFHESVHYLQVEIGGVDPLMVSKPAGCILEREAMEATNEFAEYMGLPQFKRNLREWKMTYRCP